MANNQSVRDLPDISVQINLHAVARRIFAHASMTKVFPTACAKTKLKENRIMQKKNIHFLTQAAMIAALYVVLTFIANAFGLANYAVQVRFSEALTILPIFTTAGIPGLFIGCIISNVLTGCALPDIIFGSIATLIGAFGTYKLKSNRFLAVLPPIIANAVIVPLVLKYAYGIEPLWFSFVTVTAGEIISCGVFGLILAAVLNKYKTQIFGTV